MQNLRWLLFIAIVAPLSASALRGEWESSGDMPMPYLPKYAYEYACQIEITDHKARVIDGEHVEVFAVGRVTLNNDRNFASSKDLQWNTALLNYSSGTVETPGFETFSIAGSWFSLSFDEGRAGQPDQVTLSVAVALPVAGQIVVPSPQREIQTREDGSVELKTYISAGPDESRSLFVVCDKIK